MIFQPFSFAGDRVVVVVAMVMVVPVAILNAVSQVFYSPDNTLFILIFRKVKTDIAL